MKMARKGHRERIIPEWDFDALRRDTAMLTPAARGIWMDWLGELYHPRASGRISATVEDWARLGRCTVEEAKKAIGEIRKWDVANVKTRKCGQGYGQVVDIECRRIARAYKRKEDKRLCESKRRACSGCGQSVEGDADNTQENGVPTVRKKALGKYRSISRNPKDSVGGNSVSGSGKKSTPEPIPEPVTKEAILCFADVVRLAAWICGEPNSRLTLNTFRKRYREIGDRLFRSELDSFFAEWKSGEVPMNAGAAFTARLTELSKRAQVKKSVQDSLHGSGQKACGWCSGGGIIKGVPVPDGDGFQEGRTEDQPCGFCLSGQREMEKRGLAREQQEKLVRHQIEVLRADTKKLVTA